jgi:hypothetical protein
MAKVLSERICEYNFTPLSSGSVNYIASKKDVSNLLQLIDRHFQIAQIRYNQQFSKLNIV